MYEGSAAPHPFAERMRDAIAQGTLVIPTLPDLALQIDQAMQSDDISAARAAAIIARDPAVAARVVQASNSASHVGRSKVDSLPVAVTRLGLHYTRALVHRAVLQQMFLASSPVLQELAQQTWERCVHVAALSEALASLYTRWSADMALLGGLMHRVGLLPLIRFADEHPQHRPADAATLAALFETLHPQLGVTVLEHWRFSPQLRDIPRACLDLQRDHIGPADYADIVIAAQVLLYPAAGIVPDHLPALRKLGLPPGTNGPEAVPELAFAYARALARLSL